MAGLFGKKKTLHELTDDTNKHRCTGNRERVEKAKRILSIVPILKNSVGYHFLPLFFVLTGLIRAGVTEERLSTSFSPGCWFIAARAKK
jgi:hypothetical protein